MNVREKIFHDIPNVYNAAMNILKEHISTHFNLHSRHLLYNVYLIIYDN